MRSLKQSWYSCSLSISQLSHVQKMVIYCTSSKVVLHIASISLDGHRDKIWWLDIYGNVIKNTIICPSNFNTKHLLALLWYLLCGTVTAIVGMYSVSTENVFFASTSDLDSEGRLVYPFWALL